MENNENIKNILDELSKGNWMGIDAISMIKDKVENKKFYQLLEKEVEEYQTIEDKIVEIYPKYSDGKPKETSTITKIMTWWGIEMNTLTEETDSKIAELLMNGTNMGIIEGRKLLNHKDAPEEIITIIEEYVTMQEKNVEDLKNYL